MYFVYITTNPTRTVLYTGQTNNLPQRLIEHYLNKGTERSFTGRYNCYCLLYFETCKTRSQALKRERQIKGWLRIKKEKLIDESNPERKFLNEAVMEWPPSTDVISRFRG